jgi:hypothetical protein
MAFRLDFQAAGNKDPEVGDMWCVPQQITTHRPPSDFDAREQLLCVTNATHAQTQGESMRRGGGNEPTEECKCRVEMERKSNAIHATYVLYPDVATTIGVKGV